MYKAYVVIIHIVLDGTHKKWHKRKTKFVAKKGLCCLRREKN